METIWNIKIQIIRNGNREVEINELNAVRFIIIIIIIITFQESVYFIYEAT